MGAAGTLNNYEICDLIRQEKWSKEFDDTYKVAYAYKGNQWVSFDDFLSLKYKVSRNYYFYVFLCNILP